MKYIEFKERAVERLQQFRADPGTLPRLVWARYEKNPVSFSGGRRNNLPVPAKINIGDHFAMRKHNRHQMHTQHRNSCVAVMEVLIKKLDVITLQCVHVNPTKGIRRSLYVPELARLTGLCSRTITRVLGSLTRSRYLLRQANKFFLSEHLIRDLNLSVAYSSMNRQREGRAKMGAAAKLGNSKLAKGTSKPAQKNSQAPASADQDNIQRFTPPSEASLEKGNAALAALLGRKRRPPD